MSRKLPAIFVLSIVVFLGGCAPMLPMGNTYFPGWLLSSVVGLIATGITRVILLAIGVDAVLQPRFLTYPAFAVFYTLVIYLLFFL